MITNSVAALILAPMEGVTDAPMRELMTEVGVFSHCVSEFLRVTDSEIPDRVFFRHVPEFRNGCRTPSGVPVQVQLLGGNAEMMAQAAVTAVKLGAPGIDINFGCPAPTVNRHDGGATLLKTPERLEKIVRAVRDVVPNDIPVSAKLRLGWEDSNSIFENAERVMKGGATWITIHARTKLQVYAPPVDWKKIGDVQKNSSIPVVANGDIWSIDDFRRCQDITRCHHFMIGRGALASPGLSLEIARELGFCKENEILCKEERNINRNWKFLTERFIEVSQPYMKNDSQMVARLKQWLKMAHQQGHFEKFDMVKTLKQSSQITSHLLP